MEEKDLEKVDESPVTDSSGPWKMLRHIFYYVLTAFILYYFIMASLSPVKYTKSINEKFSADSAILSTVDSRFLTDSQFIALSQRVSFIGARNRMAAGDSIGLVVDLKDSTITLEINGVALRSVPVISYEIPGSLEGIEYYQLTRFLGEPILIATSEATIPKEPLMVKIAPRDTIEALALPVITPDTTGLDPVFFRMVLSNGIELSLLQDVTDDVPAENALKKFTRKRSVKNASEGIRQVLAFKVPQYVPEIVITVSKDDARVIYRAIPEKGMVVLQIR